MKRIKNLLVIGASLAVLTISGCTANPEKTEGKARLNDYLGIPEEISYSDQVKVYDNYVEMKYLVRKSVERISEYEDFNKDGNVDLYCVQDRVIGHTDGKIVVMIASEKVWEDNNLQGSIVKYADKELQKTINEDYALLRQKGVKESGEKFSSLEVD